MREIFTRVCERFHVEPAEFNGKSDHAHLLISNLKGVSIRLLRKQFPELDKQHWKSVLWSRSYFAASCGGVPLEIIRQSIAQQKTPARRRCVCKTDWSEGLRRSG